MSLDNPSQEESEVLSRLQDNPDFQLFLALVGQDMANSNEKLIKVDMSEMARSTLIGQLRMGTRLTDAVVTSKHTLLKHRQPKS